MQFLKWEEKKEEIEVMEQDMKELTSAIWQEWF